MIGVDARIYELRCRLYFALVTSVILDTAHF
jgi:hypothetical protein